MLKINVYLHSQINQFIQGENLMNSLRNIFYIFLLSLSSTHIFADTIKFESPFPSSNYDQIYPNLQLNQIDSFKVTASTNEFFAEADITRLEIVFPFATNLIANNFVREGNVYRSLVNNAWVFKQVLVEVEAPGGLQMDSNLSIRLYIVEQTSNLNNPVMSYGHMMLQTDGGLIDTTPNRLADVTTVKVDSKNLTLRLYQRPQSGQTGYGFYIKSTWLGHGNADIYIPAINPSAFNLFQAVAVNVVSEIIGTDTIHFINIDYIDKASGQTMSTGPEDLRMYLDQAFPQ